MNCDYKTILDHLHVMGFVQNLGAWILPEINENNKENRLQIASQHAPSPLLSHQATRCYKQRFLYRSITGDEKCCLYITMKQRNELVVPEGTPKP